MLLSELRKSSKTLPRQNTIKQLWDIFTTTPDRTSLFVSFTAIEKLGINPGSEYDTPNGIYAYPLSYIIREFLKKFKDIKQAPDTPMDVIVPFAGDASWVNVFKCNGNVVSLSDNKAVTHYLSLIKEKLLSEPLNDDLYQDTTAHEFWSASLQASASDQTDPFDTLNSNKWNAVFRSIGVDGVVDPGKAIIHANEPTQAVFFSTSKLEVVARFANTRKFGSTSKTAYADETRTRVLRDIQNTSGYAQIKKVMSSELSGVLDMAVDMTNAGKVKSDFPDHFDYTSKLSGPVTRMIRELGITDESFAATVTSEISEALSKIAVNWGAAYLPATSISGERKAKVSPIHLSLINPTVYKLLSSVLTHTVKPRMDQA